MAKYTVTTDDTQDALLSWVVAQSNLRLEQTASNQDYVQSVLPSLLAPYAEQYKVSVAQQVHDAFAAADSQTQSDVLALLGVNALRGARANV